MHNVFVKIGRLNYYIISKKIFSENEKIVIENFRVDIKSDTLFVTFKNKIKK